MDGQVLTKPFGCQRNGNVSVKAASLLLCIFAFSPQLHFRLFIYLEIIIIIIIIIIILSAKMFSIHELNLTDCEN